MGRRRSPAPDAEAGAGADGKDRRFVTALARGLEVLRCFRPQDRWLAHQEIVRRSGLHNATVSRLTFTLTQLGYLRHRSQTGEYALAHAVLTLGFSMLSTFDIGRIARPHMQAFADHAQAAVSLGARHELEMVYVAHCRSTARLSLGLDVGTRLPIPSTAMGRALLCTLPTEERARLCERLQAADPTRWPRHEQALARARAQYATHGFTTSESDWDEEIAAAGVALDVGDGREPLALTVGGSAARLKGAFLYDDLGPRLVRTAQDITRSIQAADVPR